MLLHKSDNPFIVCFQISSNYSLNLFNPLPFSLSSPPPSSHFTEFEIILLSMLRNVLHVLCRLLSPSSSSFIDFTQVMRCLLISILTVLMMVVIVAFEINRNRLDQRKLLSAVLLKIGKLCEELKIKFSLSFHAFEHEIKMNLINHFRSNLFIIVVVVIVIVGLTQKA